MPAGCGPAVEARDGFFRVAPATLFAGSGASAPPLRRICATRSGERGGALGVEPLSPTQRRALPPAVRRGEGWSGQPRSGLRVRCGGRRRDVRVVERTRGAANGMTATAAPLRTPPKRRSTRPRRHNAAGRRPSSSGDLGETHARHGPGQRTRRSCVRSVRQDTTPDVPGDRENLEGSSPARRPGTQQRTGRRAGN